MLDFFSFGYTYVQLDYLQVARVFFVFSYFTEFFSTYQFVEFQIVQSIFLYRRNHWWGMKIKIYVHTHTHTHTHTHIYIYFYFYIYIYIYIFLFLSLSLYIYIFLFSAHEVNIMSIHNTNLEDVAPEVTVSSVGNTYLQDTLGQVVAHCHLN